MKRRNFIKLATTTSAIGLMPFELKAMLKTIDLDIDCGDISNRKLVLVNLVGGNDGLNTLIPINVYDTYANLRPTIRIPNSGTNGFIRLDGSLPDNQQLGLHPALTGFKSLYDQGELRILQSVGYPSQNKSHFASKDIYSTGNDGNSWNNGKDSGWIGRFMENFYPEEVEEAYPLGVQIGNGKTELGFHGAEEHGLSINITGQDPAGFFTEISGLGGQSPTNIPNSHFGEELKYIIDVNNISNKYSKSISDAFNAGNNAVIYEDTNLSNQLKTVARLISGGLPSKVYMVSIGGFDTHDNQIQESRDVKGKHYELLNEVSSAVETFMKDLNEQSLGEDVVGLTYSEFGRKAKENGNLGTDHGEIAPMFIFGKPVLGGVSGTNVDLSEATDDNNYQLKTIQYDYRQTISTLLQDFLGASDTIIDNTFFNHTTNKSFTGDKIPKIIKSEFSVAKGCIRDFLEQPGINKRKDWFIYPNPFVDQISLNALKDRSGLNYKLFTNGGSLVTQGQKETTNNSAVLDLPRLATGLYFLQVESAGNTENHKIFKL
ncbi:putative secreted protein (Por secretion system target) [Tenacibaculum skagerrakense]|uniref:Putative secreted protein (Por secretion system target) n=1 Tax=Tenacibaculum skagerrakense TaxID=186571 RepID=A0A4R2P101_9FLAO|nr:DUF1501 domain-containing protein [Tenacibaculum skagerrakense]TCP28343.1 putative secreted protein (Por secretion system target) [Tenacibaculum skagerrakense]